MTTPSLSTATTAQRFRAVMAQVPAAVTVVTTQTDGTPHGTTVSAFMSVSMNPPTLLVSLGNSSRLLSKLELGSKAVVNVLTGQQADIAAHFGHKDNDGVGVRWEHTDNEPPRLPDCLAWITFTVTEFVPVSDHTLVIGAVDTSHTTTGRPLLYWQRAYGTPSGTTT